ncbi:MAG: aspartate aminotransferase family protein [Candidatus Korarchaeota archaeon NZ13-K]|nr:MAG: aspartate aminotransferase family protein [Candidatus Korarchaeota archaeon NZ13-K]
MEFHRRRGIRLVRGRGQYVWDSEGRRYLDAHTGHGAAFLGHNPPRVVEAIREQMEKIMVCSNVFFSDAMDLCLDHLATILPRPLRNVYLQNSGTEAVELALKLAFMATGRRRILAFQGGFHGRTLGSLSVTWNPRYRRGFPSLDVRFARFNDLTSADSVDDETAAVIVEPVQGEGGIRPASADFLRELRRACDERGAVLIFDEVQSGFGRTGVIWAHLSRGVEPDIMTAGKCVGGGFPVSLVAARDWVLEGVEGGEHGSTHGGNPLACAAICGGIRTLMEDEVPDRALDSGRKLISMLKEIKGPVREVRGEGLMIGVELEIQADPVIDSLQRKGILVSKAGSSVIRILPPYMVSEEDISFLVEGLEGVLVEQGG